MRREPIQILLVEDNGADVRLTREAMCGSERKSELHVVADGVEALAFLRGEEPFGDRIRPDLVLLDLNLPRKNGREVLAEMKADPCLRRIPVAILSTSYADSDVDSSYDLGASSYIVKPLDFEKFRKIMVAFDDFWLGVVRLPTAKR